MQGALLQLGDEDVQAATTDITDVDCVDTIVCRLCVFRDEFKAPWAKMVEAPLRTLQAVMPELQVCKNPTCDS